jgi:hypothetical protein
MTYSFGHGFIKKSIPQKYVVITDEMKAFQRCARCAEQFRECDNLGQWQCLMHSLPLNSITGTFSCCSTSSRGCIRCDHTADVETPYPNSQMPPGAKCGVLAFRVEKKYADQLPNLRYLSNNVIVVETDPTALFVLRREIAN